MRESVLDSCLLLKDPIVAPNGLRSLPLTLAEAMLTAVYNDIGGTRKVQSMYLAAEQEAWKRSLHHLYKASRRDYNGYSECLHLYWYMEDGTAAGAIAD